MTYVDGFVIPVPSKKLDAYRRLARKAAKVWVEYGALEYRECVADDLVGKPMRSFRAAADTKRSETVVFSWIVYKTKKHRNRVNAKVIKDPRIAKLAAKDMPFDIQRMMYGGFKVLVEKFAED